MTVKFTQTLGIEFKGKIASHTLENMATLWLLTFNN
jgi:hypothetical protein